MKVVHEEEEYRIGKLFSRYLVRVSEDGGY